MCGVQAAIKSVRFTIQGQTLFNVIHGSKNGHAGIVEHSWSTFAPDTFLVQEVRKKREPMYIKCPRCGKEGRVNEYHPRINTRPDVTRFYVKHENIEGFWGKKNKSRVKRCRRCYFSRRQIAPILAKY